MTLLVEQTYIASSNDPNAYPKTKPKHEKIIPKKLTLTLLPRAKV